MNTLKADPLSTFRWFLLLPLLRPMDEPGHLPSDTDARSLYIRRLTPENKSTHHHAQKSSAR